MFFTRKLLCKSLFFNKASLLNSGTGVFLWILWNFSELLFYRTPPSDCFISSDNIWIIKKSDTLVPFFLSNNYQTLFIVRTLFSKRYSVNVRKLLDYKIHEKKYHLVKNEKYSSQSHWSCVYKYLHFLSKSRSHLSSIGGATLLINLRFQGIILTRCLNT